MLVTAPAMPYNGSMAIEGYLTTKQAAAILGISKGRVVALINAGRLPAEKPFGRAYLIREADLDLVRDRKPGRAGWQKR